MTWAAYSLCHTLQINRPRDWVALALNRDVWWGVASRCLGARSVEVLGFCICLLRDACAIGWGASLLAALSFAESNISGRYLLACSPNLRFDEKP